MHVPYSWQRYAPENGIACTELYDAYQAALNPGGGRWTSFRVAPMSFFIADTRSNRTRDTDPNAALATEAQWQDLEAWAAALDGPGVLVLPQPLLKAGGSKTDRTLVDFKQADRLSAVFERALGGETADGKPHDIMILTGDIHTGRVSTAEIVGLPGHDLRARRLARLARHSLSAAVGPQAVRTARPTDHQQARVDDQGATAADRDRRQQRRADQDRARPQRPLPLHAPAVARAAVLGDGAPFFGRKGAKGAQPIHDPLELELR